VLAGIGLLFLIQGCRPPVVPANKSEPFPSMAIEYSPDSLSLQLSITGNGADEFPPLNFVTPDIVGICNSLWNDVPSDISDSLFMQFVGLASKHPPEYSLQKVYNDSLGLTFDLQLDLTELIQSRDSLLSSHQSKNGPDTDGPSRELLSSLYLLLPCEGVPIPKDPELLPNSPREYRNGTHRGIDFQATWGTPVRAVATGIVLRADHEFQESSPELFQDLLKEAHLVGFTPWDIYFSRLLGRAIIIDHGLNLVPGFRAILCSFITYSQGYYTRG